MDIYRRNPGALLLTIGAVISKVAPLMLTRRV